MHLAPGLDTGAINGCVERSGSFAIPPGPGPTSRNQTGRQRQACPGRDDAEPLLSPAFAHAETGVHEFDRLGIDPPDSPHRNLPEPTAWQRARVAIPVRSCKAIVSNLAAALGTTRHRYVRLCNRQLPQSAPGSKSSLQTMKNRHKFRPEWLKKPPHHLPRWDKMEDPVDRAVSSFDTRRGVRCSAVDSNLTRCVPRFGAVMRDVYNLAAEGNGDSRARIGSAPA